MNIIVKTGFSKARIESFYKFHFRKIDYYKYIEYSVMLILLVLAILFFYIFKMITMTILCIIFAVVILGTYSYRVYVSVKRMLKKTPMDSNPYIIKINDDEITYTHGEKTELYCWKDIKSFIEIDLCYYLYVGNSRAMIIPKHEVIGSNKEVLVAAAKEKGIYKKYKFYSIDETEGVV